MPVLPMVYEPADVLRQSARPVIDFGQSLQTLIADMFETMYANQGCGLAAPQVGVSLALSVIDMSGTGKEKLILINPKIIDQRGEHELEAGCLSVPGAFAKVKRFSWVKVHAQDSTGKYFEVVGEEMFGECLQHEIDHLRGTLFTDHLSPLKRKMLAEKSRKARKRKGM